jgi:hypothetical protein
VPRAEGKSIVSSKWFYKIKHASDDNIEKFKARFMAKGFSQKEGVEYEETFVPVTRYTFMRAFMSLVSFMGWRIHQMDVKPTFFNGIIEEEVYIEQPQGFELNGKESHVEVNEKESHVCRLKKALYELKRALRAWYSRIDRYLQGMGC